jgi:anti-sigma B factor antagonist
MLRQITSSALPVTVRAAVWDGVATVTIAGELDLSTASVLSGRLDEILAAEPRLLIFDLAGVEFIDCAAIRMIIEAGQVLLGDRRPVLRHPRPLVRRILSLTGLDAQCVIEA